MLTDEEALAVIRLATSITEPDPKYTALVDRVSMALIEDPEFVQTIHEVATAMRKFFMPEAVVIGCLLAGAAAFEGLLQSEEINR